MASPLRLSLVPLLVAGCYNDPAESSEVVRNRYVDRHADAFMFQVDRGKTIEALRSVWADDGYEIDESTVAGTDVRSMPRIGRHDKTTRDECVAHFLALDVPGRYLVQIFCSQKDEQGEVFASDRREDFEWLLIQRAEPDRGLEIKRRANERADKVKPIPRRSN